MGKILVLTSFLDTIFNKSFKNRKDLEAYQQKQLEKQLSFVKANSPFYKDIEKLQDCPIINKKIMMDNFDEINTAHIKRDEAIKLAIDSEKSRDFKPMLNGYSVGLSSGTSGHRGLFVLSQDEIYRWAGTIVARLLPPPYLFNKIAFFLRADNNLYESINSPFISFKFFDLLKPDKDNFAELQKFNPTIIAAPPSVLKEMAKYIKAGHLNIKPKQIISVAEVLTPSDQELFKDVFNLKIIHQVYQCTEGFLGYTCKCGKIHLNEDLDYFEKEWLGNDRFVPIITDLRRQVQPYIRYRHNDVLVYDNEPCECGLATMTVTAIEGREDDIFIFNSVNGDVLVYPDFISRCMIYVDNISDYKVVQTSKISIDIYLDTIDEDIKRHTIDEFKQLSVKKSFIFPKINFKNYSELNIPKGAKIKHVERTFKDVER